MTLRPVVLVSQLFTFSLSVSLSEPEEPQSIPASVGAIRTSDVITIDGNLSEPVWQRAGFTGFVQRDPVENGVPTEKTEVWLAYDDGALYVAARMHETAPESMVVRLSRRDANWDSDMFFFFIDPYYDRRTGYYFALDAAGTYYDGILYNDDWNESSWDGVWEGKVITDSKGWTAEMRIPFSQLRFQESENYIWGVNFRREIARKNERNYVVFTPKNGSGFVSRFIDLTGVSNIVPVGQVEILPYITTRAEYTAHEPGNPFNDGSRYTPRIGADFKIGLGTNLTLNATANPDFGQVEVDPAVVNLSDVETFFSEKRPFFIEGSTIFSFGQGGASNNWGFNWSHPNFFYSRRIGRAPQGDTPGADYTDLPTGTDILGAAKLTGKLGDNWNVGTIQAITRREYAEQQTAGMRSRFEVEPLTYYGVTRVQKEFDGGRQGIGILSTIAARHFKNDILRDDINSSAFVTGLDGWTVLDSTKTWVITGWGGVSHIRGNKEQMLNMQQSSRRYFQRPDAHRVRLDTNATSLTGAAGRLFLTKQKGQSFFNASFGVITPEFESNDAGFLWRADIINTHAGGGYKWTEPTSLYRWLDFSAALFRSYDFDGNITWEGLWQSGYVQFPNYFSVDYSFAYNPQTISNRRTRGGPLTLNPPGVEFNGSIESDTRKDLFVDLEAGTYQAAYQRTWYINTEFRWRPLKSLSVSFIPEFNKNVQYSQWIDAFDDPTATATYGRRYVFGFLDQTTVVGSIRVNWTFTPELSLQLYVQPLISAGDYSSFKELARAKSYAFRTYGEGGSTISEQGGSYTADPDGNGPASPISFNNPDFNFKSLRGNAVLRWEYLPGSTLYLVWTQNRSDDESIGEFKFNRALSRLWDAHPDNIFMVKLSYWVNP